MESYIESEYENLLRNFGKLPGCLPYEYICVVCNHVLGVSRNQVRNCNRGHGRRIYYDCCSVWLLSWVTRGPVCEKAGDATFQHPVTCPVCACLLHFCHH